MTPCNPRVSRVGGRIRSGRKQASLVRKIPILAAFALLTLVGAQDTDHEVEERRLDDRGWYPDDATEECGWKVFKYDGKCVKNYYCRNPPISGDYKKEKGMYIDDKYCGISSSSTTTTTTTTTTTSSSSDSSSRSSDCKKWKKKYKKCKKNNKTKKVRTCMRYFQFLLILRLLELRSMLHS